MFEFIFLFHFEGPRGLPRFFTGSPRQHFGSLRLSILRQGKPWYKCRKSGGWLGKVGGGGNTDRGVFQDIALKNFLAGFGTFFFFDSYVWHFDSVHFRTFWSILI